MHGLSPPSDWIVGWAHLIAPDADVLDLACGAGRHMQHLAERGHPVLGVDRDRAALELAARWGQTIEADIESAPWPLPGRRFGAVVVTNYLWRPLWERIVGSVRPGGVLLYETFSQDHAGIGRPSRPDFLLASGELLLRLNGWRIVAYEDGFLSNPDRFVQRVAAIHPDAAPDANAAPPRHRLRG